MRNFWGLTKRNLLVFFEDKQAVVFSLLTSIIVLALYLLFLKGTFVDAINEVLDSASGLRELISQEDVGAYVNLLLFAGILGSAMVTVPFHCLTTLVKDREKGVDLDICATPVRRWQTALAYFAAAAFSAVLMTGLILTAGLCLLAFQGRLYLEASAIAAAYGVVVLGSISATALFLIVVLFFRTSSACGAFFGILSAAAGFVIGAYIPISQFSEGVQTACNVFPASHVTILLRNILLGGVLDRMDQAAGGLDNGRFTASLKETFSFKAHLFSCDLDVTEMLCYVLVFALACIVVTIFLYPKTCERK